MKTVLVFKTSVTRDRQVDELRPVLNSLIKKDERWNFDLEDCDCILRVETRKLQATHVALTLQTAGYACEELPD